MNTCLYKKLDAFALGNSGGNPAAVLYLEQNRPLSAAVMQAIAAEHKGFVSEVVYCLPQASDLFSLLYYSSECEVEFCGHGTIACMYSLIKSSPELMRRREVKINTRKGELMVYNDIAELDAIFISAPAPQRLPVKPQAGQIVAALGLNQQDLDKTLPLNCIDAGLRTLIVPLGGLETVLNTRPDEACLKAFCLSNDIDIILVFCQSTVESANIARTRVFAPRFGYLEDKATGSGNSAFGYYLLEQGLWRGQAVSIEQNGEKRAYNRVMLKTLGETVLFGGGAKLKIEGKYLL